jgi:hypothetical protein
MAPVIFRGHHQADVLAAFSPQVLNERESIAVGFYPIERRTEHLQCEQRRGNQDDHEDIERERPQGFYFSRPMTSSIDQL